MPSRRDPRGLIESELLGQTIAGLIGLTASASRRFRLDGFSSVADPGHGRGAFVAEKQHLKRLKIQPALRHDLLPANGLLDVGVNPQAHFVEVLFVRLGAALGVSDHTHYTVPGAANSLA